MDSELIKAWSAVLTALAWPITALVAIVLLPGFIVRVLVKGGILRLKLRDVVDVSVEPAQNMRPPSASPGENRAQFSEGSHEQPGPSGGVLPIDYFFLNHTSFLRKDKGEQADFRQRTGMPLDHYDIRVIVDSYYRGALERVARVEYVLHQSYPHPIQVRTRSQDKFLLKELAYGEYVLAAKVFLKDREEPVLLQRYITLWNSGPELP